ncbi:hypothetical protein GHK50_00385 [Sinorhizobium medicae]|uniref:Uncharacterized protein n=1 Tax=Sinorhizobium medicae TaxID=110321 RepID=A0A6G1WQ09_9HYPH|nr:hypothetical protein [Sinorhizobium medicae]MQV97146.1 hypothetical protein [Sinorhizobium medicae]MQW71850.1 hypothetical protein [Sinorhizobium medicae]MQX46340.1 hypothetical protein [Sinorhizobium medicae]MQX81600.1 hypothetical protein [Sinorhizobium medicae]WQO86320.1 hypothetical protein U8C37_02705 [Sinorhizobium medicae]
MRQIVAMFALGSAFGLIAPAAAQEASPGRYSMQKSETGFARLDTETGEVSLCRENNGELVCRMAADERAAFERELDLLSDRIEALERAVESGETAAKPPLPDEEEIDRAMSIMERMMRRFMGIVKEFEGDGSDSTDEDESVPQKT